MNCFLFNSLLVMNLEVRMVTGPAGSWRTKQSAGRDNG